MSTPGVAYWTNIGGTWTRVVAFPWWRNRDHWPSLEHDSGFDYEAPTPADVYRDIAALDETLYDEPGMGHPRPRLRLRNNDE